MFFLEGTHLWRHEQTEIYGTSYYGNTQNVPTSNEVNVFHKNTFSK